MCGSSENGIGIIASLIAAGAILLLAFAEKHAGAHAPAPAPHTLSAPATHVAIEMRPVTIDFDLTQARVSVEVNL
jgi:hypothetical protein